MLLRGGFAMTDARALAGLVASRICHDLISPVGAIGNGMELLQAPGSGPEEIELIADCASAASNSLQFLRMTFGERNPDEIIGLSALRAVADPYLARRKVSLSWEGAPADLPFGLAQPLAMLALTGAGALPRGGKMELLDAGAAPLRAEWRLTGPKVALTERARAFLTAPPEPEAVSPGDVHFPLLWLAAERAGARPFWRDEGIIGLG